MVVPPATCRRDNRDGRNEVAHLAEAFDLLGNMPARIHGVMTDMVIQPCICPPF